MLFILHHNKKANHAIYVPLHFTVAHVSQISEINLILSAGFYNDIYWFCTNRSLNITGQEMDYIEHTSDLYRNGMYMPSSKLIPVIPGIIHRITGTSHVHHLITKLINIGMDI